MPRDVPSFTEAYYKASGTMDEMAKEASEVFKWADDEDHDYSGELFDAIVEWQREAGERDD